MGIEPTHDGFANHCLSSWLLRRALGAGGSDYALRDRVSTLGLLQDVDSKNISGMPRISRKRRVLDERLGDQQVEREIELGGFTRLAGGGGDGALDFEDLIEHGVEIDGGLSC